MSSIDLSTSLAKAEVVLRVAATARSDAQVRYETAEVYYKAHPRTGSPELVAEAWAAYMAARAVFDTAYTAYTAAHDAIRIGATDEAEVHGIYAATQASVAEARAVEAQRFLEALSA